MNWWKPATRLQMSFSTKVLVTLVASMVLVVAVTVWTVDRRLNQEFERNGARSLAHAEGEFQNFQKLRTKTLVQRFRNLPREPRYKAVLESGHLPTVIDFIETLPEEQGVDIVLFHSPSGEVLARVKRDPHFPVTEFELSTAAASARASHGEEIADTLPVGGRLYDVVSIPVARNSGGLSGALTFGLEVRNADVQEFSLRNGNQIVLLADGRVIASTFRNLDPAGDFAALFGACMAPSGPAGSSGAMQNAVLHNEHFFCSAGKLASLGDHGKIGYLLLSSYEQSLLELQNTRQMLLLVSALGILVGTTVVWFLVRRVTQPLRALSASAEAVGKGDFSQRVQVSSRDECGELATAFNQMTENLKSSRQELERMVETLKSTQAQLIQSEKLSGIGEFVAGVAHELNNPLTAVMGFSELLKRADSDPRRQHQLEMICKSAHRCHKIVESLLSFARRRQPERKLSSVNELLEGAIDFLQYQLRTSNVEVLAQLDPSLPGIMVDPHQVQQVFLNIINNARQAMEGHPTRGCLRIHSQACGQIVRVLFQDNGPGISEKNLSRVFDPFFTTKDVGKGTGLGLSLCYGIVKDHGGTISVRSKPGEGATFVIEFPLATASDAPQPSPEPAALPDANAQEGRGKKVLVIDDEEPILQMVQETLSEHGYQVDLARDGETALERLSKTRYDLALCDWKMPGINGEQVYHRLHASNPALSERMIFFTGDVMNEKTQKFLAERHKICLAKPFSLADFRAAIARALQSTS